MYFKDSFKEYINLSYKPLNNLNLPIDKFKYKIKDVKISEYIIARIDNLIGCKILYLYSGASLLIPLPWINIFSELNTYYGNKILYKDPREDNNLKVEDNSIEIFGYLFTKLIYHLESNLSMINQEEFLDILGDICVLRTKEFIDWIRTNYNIELDPLEYTTLDNNIII